MGLGFYVLNLKQQRKTYLICTKFTFFSLYPPPKPKCLLDHKLQVLMSPSGYVCGHNKEFVLWLTVQTRIWEKTFIVNYSQQWIFISNETNNSLLMWVIIPGLEIFLLSSISVEMLFCEGICLVNFTDDRLWHRELKRTNSR